MIPKVIHYCWFGRGEKSKLAKKCIASWKKYCPDYEIIEWNEDNFDIEKYPYAKWCFENKKYAFLSDFVRLVVVSEQGGIYFDTDVEVIKTFDDLLKSSAFYGFENDTVINTGHGFGAEANHPTVIAMLNQYLLLKPNSEGVYTLVACPKLNTDALISFGLQLNGHKQTVCGAVVFPEDVFNPYNDYVGRLTKTKNTYSIHWYSKSWYSKKLLIRNSITRPFHRIFGNDCFKWLKK